ncbi:hypothetical protein [Spongorhabdus nitratireducens]
MSTPSVVTSTGSVSTDTVPSTTSPEVSAAAAVILNADTLPLARVKNEEKGPGEIVDELETVELPMVLPPSAPPPVVIGKEETPVEQKVTWSAGDDSGSQELYNNIYGTKIDPDNVQKSAPIAWRWLADTKKHGVDGKTSPAEETDSNSYTFRLQSPYGGDETSADCWMHITFTSNDNLPAWHPLKTGNSIVDIRRPDWKFATGVVLNRPFVNVEGKNELILTVRRQVGLPVPECKAPLRQMLDASYPIGGSLVVVSFKVKSTVPGKLQCGIADLTTSKMLACGDYSVSSEWQQVDLALRVGEADSDSKLFFCPMWNRNRQFEREDDVIRFARIKLIPLSAAGLLCTPVQQTAAAKAPTPVPSEVTTTTTDVSASTELPKLEGFNPLTETAEEIYDSIVTDNCEYGIYESATDQTYNVSSVCQPPPPEGPPPEDWTPDASLLFFPGTSTSWACSQDVTLKIGAMENGDPLVSFKSNFTTEQQSDLVCSQALRIAPGLLAGHQLHLSGHFIAPVDSTLALYLISDEGAEQCIGSLPGLGMTQWFDIDHCFDLNSDITSSRSVSLYIYDESYDGDSESCPCLQTESDFIIFSPLELNLADPSQFDRGSLRPSIPKSRGFSNPWVGLADDDEDQIYDTPVLDEEEYDNADDDYNLLASSGFETPLFQKQCLLHTKSPSNWFLWPAGKPVAESDGIFCDDIETPFQDVDQPVIRIEYGSQSIDSLTQHIAPGLVDDSVERDFVVSFWIRSEGCTGTLYTSINNSEGIISMEGYPVTGEKWQRRVRRLKVPAGCDSAQNGLTFYLFSGMQALLKKSGDCVEIAGLDFRYEPNLVIGGESWAVWSEGAVAEGRGRVIVNTGPAPTKTALLLEYEASASPVGALTQCVTLDSEQDHVAGLSLSCWIKSSQPGSVLSSLNSDDGGILAMESYEVGPSWKKIRLSAPSVSSSNVTCYVASCLENLLSVSGGQVQIAGVELLSSTDVEESNQEAIEYEGDAGLTLAEAMAEEGSDASPVLLSANTPVHTSETINSSAAHNTLQQGRNLLKNSDFAPVQFTAGSLFGNEDLTEWTVWTSEGISTAGELSLRADDSSPFKWSGRQVLHLEYGNTPITALTGNIPASKLLGAEGKPIVLSCWIRLGPGQGNKDLYTSISKVRDGNTLSFQSCPAGEGWERRVIKYKGLTEAEDLMVYLLTSVNVALTEPGHWVEIAGLDIRPEPEIAELDECWLFRDENQDLQSNGVRIVINDGPAPVQTALRLEYRDSECCIDAICQPLSVSPDSFVTSGPVTLSLWVRASQVASLLSAVGGQVNSYMTSADWHRVIVTYDEISSLDGEVCLAGFLRNILKQTGGFVNIAGVKLELGAQATEFLPQEAAFITEQSGL